MAVQHSYRTETLDIRQSLFTVVGSPSPIGVDGPQRNVREEHNRSAGRAALEIGLKPLQLFVTERPHASSLQICDIYQTDEVHTSVIEALPPAALGTLPLE